MEPGTNQPELPLVPAAEVPVTAPGEDEELDALERALAFQQDGQHSQVIEAAVSHLEAGAPAEGAEPSFLRAALWTLVGVSRHALGDIEGAQGALDAAVREAPDGVSEGCPQRIAVVAAPAARQLLAAADAMSATSGERVLVLRMAVLWLEWRIVAAPATEEVAVLLDRSREALWDGYVLAGQGLMRRRQFSQARDLVRQALDSEDLPAARRPPLADLAARCVVRQLGRLVATARGTETPEAEALDALERARELLASTSVDTLTPARWHAANRRIWSGYMRLGRRSIEGFDLEAALRPLFRALHLRDLDLGLERRTRELLARTIERISDGAAETIGRLLEAGDREAAMQRWQDVRAIIQKARDQGLSHDELAQAFSRARQLLEQIEASK
jgi:tetratricopeptide (TPR) repeat protein